MKTYMVCFVAIFSLSLSSIGGIPAVQDQKTPARIDIKYYNTAINERYITIKVTTRIDRRYQPVPAAEISIYQGRIAETEKLGSITMNEDGLATFVLPPKFYRAIDTLSGFTFFCTLTNHPQVEDKETDLSIKEIELKTEYIDQDTLKWIRAVVLEKNGRGLYTSIEDAEVKFFVTRPFNILPISEPVMTDENGKATIQFPDDLPGDAAGYVTAVVKIDGSDDYGTVEKRETVQWGVPTTFSDESVKRSLWAAGANAPIFVLLLTNILIAITWGIIFYIVHQIYCISKL